MWQIRALCWFLKCFQVRKLELSTQPSQQGWFFKQEMSFSFFILLRSISRLLMGKYRRRRHKECFGFRVKKAYQNRVCSCAFVNLRLLISSYSLPSAPQNVKNFY